MNGGIFELIFFLIIEDDAFVINKVQDPDSPNWTAKILNHKLIHPFLQISIKIKNTSSD